MAVWLAGFVLTLAPILVGAVPFVGLLHKRATSIPATNSGAAPSGYDSVPPDRNGRGRPPPGDHSQPGPFSEASHDVRHTFTLFGVVYYADELPDKGDTQPGGHIHHDKIYPFNEDASDEARLLQPGIIVADDKSCYPYPAIDYYGRLSGGLKAKNKQNGDCGFDYYHSQMYVRNGTVRVADSTPPNVITLGGNQTLPKNARTKLQDVYMYSIYLPKEQNRNANGHRHSFDNVVFFLKDRGNVTAGERVARDVSYVEKACFARAYEDRYECTTSPTLGHRVTDGLDYNVYSIAYEYSAEADRHDMRPGPQGEIYDDDSFPPLIQWDRMPRLPRAILNSDPFDEVKVPFSDTHFDDNVEKARTAPVWSNAAIL